MREKKPMVSEPQPGARNACPRCGKPPGWRWWHLLPTNNSRRVLTCAHCKGGYDFSDSSKIASIMGGLLGLGPAVLLLGKIVKYGHGSRVWVVVATAAAALLFMTGSVLLGWLTARLIPKP
jgi:uncharacterized protein (DUF983 family)